LLNRLQFLRSVGQFDSVQAGAALPFARITLGYAENGRGKTTLAAILRSLATGDALPIIERHRLGANDPPHVVIDCSGGPQPTVFQNGAWNRTVPEIAIFDDLFVDQNICSGLVVESEHRQKLHEFILGAQGVALNAALQQIVAQIETHNRELRAKADAIPAIARGNLSVDDFCGLPVRKDIDAEILEAERALGAAKDQEAVRDAQLFSPVSLPAIDQGAIEALLRRDLPNLEQTAADRVYAHLSRLGERAEAWIAYGLSTIPSDGAADQADKLCPFCAQSLRGSEIIAHYRAYFGDAYASLQRDLAETIKQLDEGHAGDAPARFERSIRVLSERASFWSRFTDVPRIDLRTEEITATWSAAREAVRIALAYKQINVLEPIRLTESQLEKLSAYNRVRGELAALNQRLQDANNAIRLVKEQAAAGNYAALESDLVRLRATRERHSPAIAPFCTAYLEEKAAKATTEQERENTRTALDQYRTSIFPAYQGGINDYLRKFNAGFRLDQITSQNIRGGSACTYSVLINNRSIPVAPAGVPGAPSFRNTLSAGDRNTLALAFFFTALDQSANLANLTVVIDDPVSSLDDHRSLTTVQEMRRLMQRTAQVVVLSHNKPFLCALWEGADTTLRAALEFVREGDGSSIRAWDVTRDMVTEHDRRHALLRGYIESAGNNSREVAESLRPVLEAFVRVAFPQYYPAGSLLGPFRGLCEQRVGTPREILSQSDIDELRDLTEYANRFHHDTNTTWQSQHINDAQLLDFVRRVLAFATR
jgi:wobble nucleotide-excising tRNase